jgi:hypothetical protein
MDEGVNVPLLLLQACAGSAAERLALQDGEPCVDLFEPGRADLRAGALRPHLPRCPGSLRCGALVLLLEPRTRSASDNRGSNADALHCSGGAMLRFDPHDACCRGRAAATRFFGRLRGNSRAAAHHS